MMQREFLAIQTLTLIAAFTIPVACIPQEPFSSSLGIESKAKEILDKMRDSFRDAESLSLESKFDVEVLGVSRFACIYRVWLKKPNLFRVEVRALEGKTGGVIVGDGSDMWIYWPSGRPQYESIAESAYQRANWETSFMRKPVADVSRMSIAHEMPFLAAGMGFPILDVSLFHGHVEPLAKHIDAYRYLGHETIDGNRCDKIEVSILDRQRSQYFWIAHRDYFPRRLVEIVRLNNDVVTREEWSQLRVNDEIPDEKFSWTPPAGWQQWELSDGTRNWPPIGSRAPDFALTSTNGERVRLSEFRGKVVWLNFWRMGCPPCVEELPLLQRIHERLGGSGLELIGINITDDKRRLRELLDKKKITYLNILDESPSAKEIYLQAYSVGAIPLNCVIDRTGRMIDIWVGYSEERATTALREAGLTIDDDLMRTIRNDMKEEHADYLDPIGRSDSRLEGHPSRLGDR